MGERMIWLDLHGSTVLIPKEKEKCWGVDKNWQVLPSYKKRFVFSEVACDMGVWCPKKRL